MTSGTDELVARWKKGEFEAFESLIEPYLTQLRTLAAWCAPPTALWDKEELVQEALVEAYKSAGDYDPQRGNLQAWLRVVVRDRLRRAWQEYATRPKRQYPAMLRFSERCERDFQRQVDPGGLLEALSGCLERLAPEQRDLLVALYSEGLSGEQIAARRGGSPAAAYVALHRAHRTLRESLDAALEGKAPA